MNDLLEVRQALEALLRRQPKWAVTAIQTAAYTAEAGELVRVNPTAGGFTVTLPAASEWNDGRLIAVKNVSASANTITVAAAAGQTVDGAASLTIVIGYGTVTLVSNGSSGWMIV